MTMRLAIFTAVVCAVLLATGLRAAQLLLSGLAEEWETDIQ